MRISDWSSDVCSSDLPCSQITLWRGDGPCSRSMVSSMAWVRDGGPLCPAPHGPRCSTASAQGEVDGDRTVLPASARCEAVLLHGLDRSMVEDIVRQGADHAHIGDRSIGIDCEGNPHAALDA